MRAHQLASLNSAQRSTTDNLDWHCVHGHDLVTQSILHSEFFPVILLFQLILPFSNVPQALSPNLKLLN